MIIDDDPMDALDLAFAEASEQRSELWRDVRLGRFTGSEIYKLMTNPRGKGDEDLNDTATAYVREKVAETLTGQAEVKTSFAMEWGIDHEPLAIAFFEKLKNVKVKGASFVAFGDHAGGTPDGYVDGRLLEVKCPYNSKNHLEFLLCRDGHDLKEAEPKYWWQIQANLLFTQMSEAWFVSFDPRSIKPEHKIQVLNIKADKADQARVHIKIAMATEMKKQILNQL